ncbi:type II toxin-antitoxin system HipA family toxin [Pseudomonas sp. PB120]|uniref:type II toxin-antitoxin system HipA family toxin n=1 Tax=Pseudomonas sp. PB120 TaxID=2494700 RepID=UPI0012FDB971|nr:HipA domain-containing protein [Pseudomonas sp. PB120]MVV52272.1 type II toxin-antitoxin system HipA family toxin [Pseudomonas sp. PB120]
MPSEDRVCYVWAWLPGNTEPVVAGRLVRQRNDRFAFLYGQSYLKNPNAIPLNNLELPLGTDIIEPPAGLKIASGIRDASPDAWGRRVIINRLHGKAGLAAYDQDLDEQTYMLESGSDRIGGLDFQLSPTEYISRSNDNATLEELLNAAELVEKGIPLTSELDQALRHGSSIGGARPKALIKTDDVKYVAKFSASNDTVSVVKSEFIMMRLASLIGLEVAPVKLEQVLGKDVLLIERFDRVKQPAGWARRIMVSALTLLELDEMMARYTSYEDLTHVMRKYFRDPKRDLHELFSRLVFNILCGNTDDHARNHAAFFDGKAYRLTPAYDICPQNRSGNVASQGMLIMGEANQSQIALCLEAAHLFLLDHGQAKSIVLKQIEGIRAFWDTVCQASGISLVDRNVLATRQVLNAFAFENLKDEDRDIQAFAEDVRRVLPGQ